MSVSCCGLRIAQLSAQMNSWRGWSEAMIRAGKRCWSEAHAETLHKSSRSGCWWKFVGWWPIERFPQLLDIMTLNGSITVSDERY